MSYRQVLDEAIGDSPASKVDVDAVIDGQRRALRLRRWGACGAGVAAVLAVTVVATQMLQAPPPVQPAEAPRITTVAGTPEDMTRLDNAVIAALKREVPGLKWRDSATPDTPKWWHTENAENTLAFYFGQGGISVNGIEAHFMVHIGRHGAQQSKGLSCVEDTSESTCRESVGPRGERLWIRAEGRVEPSLGPDPTQHRFVHVLRPDDTMVTVSMLHVTTPAGVFPMTLEQQSAIAFDPAIALAPVPPGVVVTPPAPEPSVSLEPSKVEPYKPDLSGPMDPAEQQRIDNAVFASVRRQAPTIQGVKGARDDSADLAAVWTESGGQNTANVYWGQGLIMVNGTPGLFSVVIHREDPGFSGDLQCGKPSRTYACARGKGPHAERYRTVTNTSWQGSSASAERSVDVLRQDGTWLSVGLTADSPAAKFALTVAQQQAIAFDQAVALAGR